MPRENDRISFKISRLNSSDGMNGHIIYDSRHLNIASET